MMKTVSQKAFIFSKRIVFTLFLISVSNNLISAQSAINRIEFGDDGVVYLDDFENYKTGTIPHEWYNRDGDRLPAEYEENYRKEYKYWVEKERGNKFLRYSGTEAKHLNFPLLDKKELNIYDTPLLRWKWRIHEVPAGGNEDHDDRNDVAASIYVVFDMGRVMFRKVPKSIRYTWSSSLPVGREMSKFFGNQKVVVVGSGEDGLGTWKTFERNIVEDYKRLFGDNPPKTPMAILILSDADNTQSNSKADYDDIELHPLQSN